MLAEAAAQPILPLLAMVVVLCAAARLGLWGSRRRQRKQAEPSMLVGSPKRSGRSSVTVSTSKKGISSFLRRRGPRRGSAESG